ncbi:MAG TPA: cation-translocating P-type ATPase [Burkholderiaceae bacterium]
MTAKADIPVSTDTVPTEFSDGGMLAHGLSDSEAARRLASEGYNELPSKQTRTLWHISLEVAREPMFSLLLVAGAIYLALGDPQDAAMLLGFVFISMGITIFQERRTERVLEALRDLSSPRALVIRGGRQSRIPGREVVLGDLLVLEEGDRVAADGALVESHDLLIDESLLTGESVAVAKSIGPTGGVSEPAEADDAHSRVYSGSMVVQGGGLARVSAVGGGTELGKIGSLSQAAETGKSALQREIGRLVTRFSVIGVAVSLLVFAAYGWTRGDWLNGFLAGVSLAMSMLPEEFTVILTVFMAMGAWRISKSKVLTRRTPVIEALGSATVLCVDKTGTVTENRMSVKAAVVDGLRFEVGLDSAARHGEALRQLLKYAVLASEIMPFDPMEKAFHRSMEELFPAERTACRGWALAQDYALSREWTAMTHAWRVPGSREHIVATKGAPESVARLCGMSEGETSAMLVQVQALAAQGLRVLAVAKAVHRGGDWPAGQDGFRFEWIGLAGLADPIRAEVPQSVNECREAGIRVVMITGDFPATAQAIARQAGLPCESVVTGAQLDAMDEAELARVVRDTCVFARIRPEQKLRLVQGLKTDGEIVAMTGDGVNDVPALKAAHIAIGMGERGTDVAREASSLVLLNDDFTSIVRTIRLGRRIYANIGKALIFVVAAHLPIAGLTLLPLVLGAPIALAPIHIVFLEMIINPSCALIFEAEPEEEDVMSRPPRRPEEKLFDVRSLVLSTLQGLGLLAGVAVVFFLGLRSGLAAEQARALAFITLVAGDLGLIVTSRSAKESVVRLIWKKNAAQWWIIAGTVLALAGIMRVDLLQSVFHFAPVGAGNLSLAAVVAVAVIAWFELVKRWLARRP